MEPTTIPIIEMMPMLLSLCFAVLMTESVFHGSTMKSKIGSKNKTPMCPCTCGKPQQRGSQLGLVKNTFGGTRTARWVLLDCAIEKSLEPFVKNPNFVKGMPTSLKYIPYGETPPPREEPREVPKETPKEEPRRC